MVWLPTSNLIEEVLDDQKLSKFYVGITGFLSWTIISIILAPGVLFILLRGNNDEIIVELANKIIEFELDE